MTSNPIEITLQKALEKTRSGNLNWKVSKQRNRYFANLEEWRLRIESEISAGEHPFKFSLVQPGNRQGEIEAIRSVEADRPLTPVERERNQALRELWEAARRDAKGINKIGELNRLLDSL